MGHNGDISPEQTATPLPTGIELSQLIREEVRAVVREQILVPTSEPAPPSYDSTSRLLTTDASDLRNDSLDGVDNALLQDPEDPKPSPSVILSQIPRWLRIVIRVIPFIAVIISIPLVAKSGRDPLLLSVAALILLLSVYTTAIMPLFIIGVATAAGSEKSSQDEEQQSSKEKEEKKDSDGDSFSYFLSYHFSVTYLVFGLVLWAWFVARDDSLLATHQLAERFDAKIDTTEALSKLTTCFYDTVPDRNVTVQDFTRCLAKLGIDPGH